MPWFQSQSTPKGHLEILMNLNFPPPFTFSHSRVSVCLCVGVAGVVTTKIFLILFINIFI